MGKYTLEREKSSPDSMLSVSCSRRLDLLSTAVGIEQKGSPTSHSATATDPPALILPPTKVRAARTPWRKEITCVYLQSSSPTKALGTNTLYSDGPT